MQRDCALIHIYGVQRALISNVAFADEADLRSYVWHFPHVGRLLAFAKPSYQLSNSPHDSSMPQNATFLARAALPLQLFMGELVTSPASSQLAKSGFISLEKGPPAGPWDAAGATCKTSMQGDRE